MRTSQTTGPLVSVLLPAYNAETTVARAIDSIQSQSFTDWELIFADDGSTDRTAQIASSAARLDARIKVHRFEQRGLVPTLNEAMALARGPLLARMDADDVSAPERLALQTDYLNKNRDVGLVASGVEFGGDRLIAPGFARYTDWLNSIVSAEDISLNRFIESPVPHPSVMYRRDTVKRHGGYRDTDWPEDYELWLRWLEGGVRFAKIPKNLLTWNDSPGRLSRRHPRYRVESFYACKCHYLSKWIQKTVDPRRPIVLWGAGRITRKRFRALEAEGTNFAGFIDVDPRKFGQRIGDKPVHKPSAIPSDGRWFIISGVGNRGAREKIRQELRQCGYREGIDCIIAA